MFIVTETLEGSFGSKVELVKIKDNVICPVCSRQLDSTNFNDEFMSVDGGFIIRPKSSPIYQDTTLTYKDSNGCFLLYRHNYTIKLSPPTCGLRFTFMVDEPADSINIIDIDAGGDYFNGILITPTVMNCVNQRYIHMPCQNSNNIEIIGMSSTKYLVRAYAFNEIL